ncbi:TonB-dependent receptor [Pseudoalteromonas sp. Cnat2-41]|uniref:TonB-dependent receptor plug domain-containing protein n=1 Tax=unclassified Pseudoalteromonas TaxID=194690 RepID=UPI001EF8778F|nr:MULTISPECIES: TonB-dependent receptor [unclassified Pseudoalteromonas]MCF2860844.1 TonB-dependent receptor [Pseudoalteromonas sp. CNAT2-18]MCG7556713.1 TonB-dependent receptor [Pseudoalteromonas sp. CNAT2-18.1]
MTSFKLKALVAALALTNISAYGAQENANKPVKVSEELVVYGDIGYRNRSQQLAPTLEYDQDYFQRFEPLTAGDALKRVPSVTFLSDVLESDGARMRGLSPAYTKVLINGEEVPGAGADRSFFVDRIPAELIERVEIIRSPSANRSADAIAGTLNIVLRDGYSLDGGYLRAGGLRYDDGEFKESLGGVYGTELGGGRLLLGANLQGRYNPKKKTSFRYGDSPENNPDYREQTFDNREHQDDTRDGDDTSLNASYEYTFNDGAYFDISGIWVDTERSEDERSYEYNHPSTASGDAANGGSLLTDNANIADIEQTNYSLSSSYNQPLFGGNSKFKVAVARFEESVFEQEVELDTAELPMVLEQEQERSDIDDKEWTLQWQHSQPYSDSKQCQIGVFWQQKERDTDIFASESELETMQSSWDQFAQSPLSLATFDAPFVAVSGGVNTVQEQRFDVFALLKHESQEFAWELGVRWESTDSQVDNHVDAVRTDNDYDFILPSAHIRVQVAENGRINASVARSLRRPDFDYITPALREEELADNDLLGNPALEPESAWGVDLGYEYRLGKTGVMGVNLFYRDVSDLIEIANTGMQGAEGEGTFVLQPRNTGDGTVYGVELDLSTPLGALGLPNTGVFVNYSWLDSEVEDFFGERKFNDQSDYVYNLGFIHDFPQLGASFGATYRKQGDALGRFVGEEVSTHYGADLELFIEKRWQKLTLRMVGSNLLDASKEEVFNKFDTLEQQIERDFDEYELESEQAGPVVQLMLRYAF